MTIRRHRIFLLYGEMAPYRLALFETISREVDLYVHFCMKRSAKRVWTTSKEGYSFKSKVLSKISLGPLVINYSLPLILFRGGYDAYIIDDDPRLTFSALFVFITSKITKRPVIIWSETIGENYFGTIKRFVDRHILRPLRCLLYSHSDALLASGDATENFLIGKGIRKENIYVGTQGLSEPQLKSGISKYNPRINLIGLGDSKVIFFMGYFTKRKGVAELIEAFNQLNRNDAVLVVAGSGPEERNLKAMASKQNNILFPGYIEERQKAMYLSSTDIFTLPTFADPWGLVIMEAMMFGLPIITTTAAGASELIRGNGIVIEPGDKVALKESLEYLLSNDEIREEMGRKSKEIIKDYTVERAADTFIRAIDYCLNGRTHATITDETGTRKNQSGTPKNRPGAGKNDTAS